MYVSTRLLPALVATVACLAMVGVAWRRREAPGAPAYAALMLALAHWALLQLLLVGADALETKLLFAKIQYLGIAFAPLGLLAFSLSYTDRGHWLRGWRLPALAAIPALSVGMAFSNDLHGLLWSEVSLQPGAPTANRTLDIHYGPWFQVQVAYGYATALSGAALLFSRLGQAPHHRRLLIGLLSAIAVVLTFNGAYLSGFRPMGGIDPTPASFAAASAVLGWCLYRYRLFDLVPLAREVIFDGIEDPVVALDGQGRVRDLNVAARVLVVSEHQQHPVGAPAAACLADPLPAVLEHLRPGGRAEVAIETAGIMRSYDVVFTALGRGDSRLLVMRDISERKETELALLRVQEELRHANSELGRLANTDALTGLTNRRRWIQSLDREVARALRYEIPLGIVLLDVDHFKQVNDRRGHFVGDRVLVELARVLEQERRFHDVAARVGGEEFALLISHATARGLAVVGERLRSRIEGLLHVDDREETFSVTISLGLAMLRPGDGDRDGSDVLRRADAALYRAKQAGRNRVETAPCAEPEGRPPARLTM